MEEYSVPPSPSQPSTPAGNISLPKMDEQEPISPGLVAVLGRGPLFTSGTREQVKQVEAQG